MKLSEIKENLKLENCFKIGIITKSHGVSGHVLAQFFVDFTLTNQSWIFVKLNNIPVPFEVDIKKSSFNITDVYLKLFDFNDVKDVKRIIKQDLYLPKKMFKNPEKFIVDFENFIIGFKLMDTKKNYLGIFSSFIDDNKNPLFSINRAGDEFLVPANAIEIKEIDYEANSISAELPEDIFYL